MLTKGVAALFKKNKVTHYAGHGRLSGAGRVDVVTGDGKTELQAKHILLATGSKSAPPQGRRGRRRPHRHQHRGAQLRRRTRSTSS
jgi:pyruvate/2-oxoglutarate dehydrogenase complex dihydrolipoamide dehydrogenase (E3) component